MKDRKLIVAIAILLISTLACSLTGSADPASAIQTLIPSEAQTLVASVVAPAATELAGSESDGSSPACANPLYPVVVGATWSYSLTGPLSDTFTRSIVALTTDGFTDQDVFSSGTTRTGQWTCDSGNLTSLDPGGSSADTASVQATGLNSNFQTTALEGVTLPAEINSGTSWNQNFTLEGVQEFNGQQVSSKNVTSYNCTALGEESISVAAGTFTAMRIDCQTQITITIMMAGMEIPTSINSTTTSWYSSGVGWVKSISELGDGSTSNIELTTYNIP